jgi:hypothetical protein
VVFVGVWNGDFSNLPALYDGPSYLVGSADL